MRKTLLLLGTLCTLSAHAQIFTQNFEGAAPKVVTFTNTDSSQFNVVAPVATGTLDGASVVNNHGSKKLQMKRTTTNSAYVRKYLGYNYPAKPIYGALIGGLNVAYANKPKVAKALGIIHMREALILSNRATWTNNMYDTGYKLVLNVNFDKDTVPVPFPTDTLAYKDTLMAALNNGIVPALMVVENEEPNKGKTYHSGFAKTYLNELRAATTVARTFGYKVTNGGITAEVLRYLTYHYYYDDTSHGKDSTKAVSFKSRTLDNTSYNSAGLKERGTFADTCVRAYATIAIDYVNFHWYAGTARGAQTDVMSECIDYLQAVTGKKAMTNEIGQYNNSGATTDSLLRGVLAKGLPVVMWYDADGDGDPGQDKAKALNDLNGNLNAKGDSFAAFIADNDLNYEAPQFISVSFKLRDTLSGDVPAGGNIIAVGNRLSPDAAIDDSVNIHSRLSLVLNSTGSFRIRDPHSTYISASFSGEQVIKWYINNSGSTRTYNAPNGTTQSLGNDSFIVWTAAASGGSWTKLLNGNRACANPGAPLTDFKFLFNAGAATLFFDEFLIYDEINHPSARGVLEPATMFSAEVGNTLKAYSPEGQDVVKVSLAAEDEDEGTLLIYDLNGRRINELRIAIHTGDNTYAIAARLAPGIYIAQVRSASGILVHKFAKQ